MSGEQESQRGEGFVNELRAKRSVPTASAEQDTNANL